MIEELVKKVTEKIVNEKMLIIGIDLAGSHELNRILPEKINTEHGIYIEGENYILDISDKEKYDTSTEVPEDFLRNAMRGDLAVKAVKLLSLIHFLTAKSPRIAFLKKSSGISSAIIYFSLSSAINASISSSVTAAKYFLASSEESSTFSIPISP